LSRHELALALLLGAAALAAWAEARFPRLGPRAWSAVLVHVALSMVVLNGLTPPLMRVVLAAGGRASSIVAAVGVAVPALVYALLASFWLLRFAQRAASGSLG